MNSSIKELMSQERNESVEEYATLTVSSDSQRFVNSQVDEEDSSFIEIKLEPQALIIKNEPDDAMEELMTQERNESVEEHATLNVSSDSHCLVNNQMDEEDSIFIEIKPKPEELIIEGELDDAIKELTSQERNESVEEHATLNVSSDSHCLVNSQMDEEDSIFIEIKPKPEELIIEGELDDAIKELTSQERNESVEEHATLNVSSDSHCLGNSQIKMETSEDVITDEIKIQTEEIHGDEHQELQEASSVVQHKGESSIRTQGNRIPFQCEYCSKAFLTKGNLQRHKSIKHPEPREYFLRKNENKKKSNLRSPHEEKKAFKCLKCGKGFASKARLNDHMRTHSGNKPLKCTKCEKIFSPKDNRKTHMLIHAREKAFENLKCGEGFVTKDHLNEHIKTRSGNKLFKCRKGGEHFLRTNRKTHEGEKAFKCLKCGKDFVREDHLNEHMKTHCGNKPFQCTKCGKDFSTKGHCKTHMITHEEEKPFKCLKCGKGFTSKARLNEHMRTHSENKPLKCTKCGKKFSPKDNRKTHMLIHAREKAFKGKTISMIA